MLKLRVTKVIAIHTFHARNVQLAIGRVGDGGCAAEKLAQLASHLFRNHTDTKLRLSAVPGGRLNQTVKRTRIQLNLHLKVC